jgi:hypothetical protein
LALDGGYQYNKHKPKQKNKDLNFVKEVIGTENVTPVSMFIPQLS